MQPAFAHPDRSHEAHALLAELSTAHGEVIKQSAAMQALQDQPQPRPDQWAYARWMLSRASRQRRTCVDKIYALLSVEALPHEAARVRALQDQDAAMLGTSRAHVSHWTPERIESDWAGYSRASRIVRQGMEDRVRAEQEVLIPILERIAGV